MNLREAIGQVIEFCYPSACGRCGAAETRDFLCAACDAEMEQLAARGQCGRCAKPLVGDGAPCPYCRGSGMYPFDSIASVGVFEGVVKDLIHHMKYHGKWGIGEQLALRMAELHRVRVLVEEADVIVPVPLYRWRQVKRGYNQSAVIARQLGAMFGKPVREIVSRTRDTATQVDLHSQKAREENVRGAFRLKRPEHARDRRVLVVDDVLTTGSTIREVGRVLKKAGPVDLAAVVVAVADPKGRGFEAI